MTYRVTYEDRKDYLFAHIEGPESYEDASLFWEELRRMAELRGYDRFLIVDEVTGVLNPDDIYWISAKVATLFYGKVIAYVDPKEESFSANTLGESVVSERGVRVKLFRREHEAIQWLYIASRGAPG